MYRIALNSRNGEIVLNEELILESELVKLINIDLNRYVVNSDKTFKIVPISRIIEKIVKKHFRYYLMDENNTEQLYGVLNLNNEEDFKAIDKFIVDMTIVHGLLLHYVSQCKYDNAIFFIEEFYDELEYQWKKEDIDRTWLHNLLIDECERLFNDYSFGFYRDAIVHYDKSGNETIIVEFKINDEFSKTYNDKLLLNAMFYNIKKQYIEKDFNDTFKPVMIKTFKDEALNYYNQNQNQE